MDDTFLDARIARAKAQIVAYEDAIDALLTDQIQSYTLDTGQTNQTVTKMNISALQAAVDMLMNRLATLQARRFGNGVVIVRPGF